MDYDALEKECRRIIDGSQLAKYDRPGSTDLIHQLTWETLQAILQDLAHEDRGLPDHTAILSLYSLLSYATRQWCMEGELLAAKSVIDKAEMLHMAQLILNKTPMLELVPVK